MAGERPLAMADLALSGLASGVDTAAIVDQLMAIERQAHRRACSCARTRCRRAADDAQDLKTKLDALKTRRGRPAARASTWAETQTVESSDPRARPSPARRRADRAATPSRSRSSPRSAQKTYGWTPSAAASQTSRSTARTSRSRHGRHRGRRRRSTTSPRRSPVYAARVTPRWSAAQARPLLPRDRRGRDFTATGRGLHRPRRRRASPAATRSTLDGDDGRRRARRTSSRTRSPA